MHKLIAIALAAALVPSLAFGASFAASFKFNDEVRAGKTLKVTGTQPAQQIVALMPQELTSTSTPIASNVSWNWKKGKLLVKVPAGATPGTYDLALFDYGRRADIGGHSYAERLKYEVVGTVTVLPAKVAKKSK
jgi:hypothetical protein